MTAKERVLITLACREADRVPINYFANAGIDARLKAHYGLRANDDEGLLRVLGDDARAAELRERGLARAAEFTWRRAAERHLEPGGLDRRLANHSR